MRVVRVRTGVVLDKDGGALGKMLPFFKAGVGGPVAGGDQLMPWIHVDDVVGIYLRAIDDAALVGPVNATAPEPVTNKAFSKALGRALHRPALAPVPAFAIQLLYGDMSEIVTKGQNAVPRRTLELGYRHAHPDLDEALRSALGATDRAVGSAGHAGPWAIVRGMHDPLPPDLARLGDQLAAATARARARARRKARWPARGHGRGGRARAGRVRAGALHPSDGGAHAGDRGGERVYRRPRATSRAARRSPRRGRAPRRDDGRDAGARPAPRRPLPASG